MVRWRGRATVAMARVMASSRWSGNRSAADDIRRRRRCAHRRGGAGGHWASRRRFSALAARGIYHTTSWRAGGVPPAGRDRPGRGPGRRPYCPARAQGGGAASTRRESMKARNSPSITSGPLAAPEAATRTELAVDDGQHGQTIGHLARGRGAAGGEDHARGATGGAGGADGFDHGQAVVRAGLDFRDAAFSNACGSAGAVSAARRGSRR